MNGAADYFSDFAAALKYWRGKRGYSQLRLSTESAISQRHISFLESGRSQPSKDLILKLGMVLEIPLRQRNVMLLAAGVAGMHGAGQLAVNLDRRALPFLPVTLRKDGVELNLFTTIATLGTPHDVTVHELRIEAFFPADQASAAWFRARHR